MTTIDFMGIINKEIIVSFSNIPFLFIRKINAFINLNFGSLVFLQFFYNKWEDDLTKVVVLFSNFFPAIA